jgi:hypothetical protein
MKDFLVFALLMALGVFVLYGSYWVCKNVSYAIFYEDMVIQSITETVKKTCIR